MNYCLPQNHRLLHLERNKSQNSDPSITSEEPDIQKGCKIWPKPHSKANNRIKTRVKVPRVLV